MRQKIKTKIQNAKIESEFGIELIPRRRGPSNKGFIERPLRDENGDHVTKDGQIVLTHVRPTGGRTLTPSEQYRKSTLRRIAKGIFHLTKEN